MFNLSQIFIW